jgi:hypothetical protein
MVVAEEPGIGLGAALAGLDSVDPGAGWAAPPAWPRPEMADRHFRARIGKTGLKWPLLAENSPIGKGFDGQVHLLEHLPDKGLGVRLTWLDPVARDGRFGHAG